MPGNKSIDSGGSEVRLDLRVASACFLPSSLRSCGRQLQSSAGARPFFIQTPDQNGTEARLGPIGPLGSLKRSSFRSSSKTKQHGARKGREQLVELDPLKSTRTFCVAHMAHRARENPNILRAPLPKHLPKALRAGCSQWRPILGFGIGAASIKRPLRQTLS